MKFSKEFNINPEAMVHFYNLLIINVNSTFSLFYFLNKGKVLLKTDIKIFNDSQLKSSSKNIIEYI